MEREPVGVPVVTVLPITGIILGLGHRLLTPGDEGRRAVDLALRIAALKCAGVLGLLRLLEGLRLAREVGVRVASAGGGFAPGSARLVPVPGALLKALVARALG